MELDNRYEVKFRPREDDDLPFYWGGRDRRLKDIESHKKTWRGRIYVWLAGPFATSPSDYW